MREVLCWFQFHRYELRRSMANFWQESPHWSPKVMVEVYAHLECEICGHRSRLNGMLATREEADTMGITERASGHCW